MTASFYVKGSRRQVDANGNARLLRVGRICIVELVDSLNPNPRFLDFRFQFFAFFTDKILFYFFLWGRSPTVVAFVIENHDWHTIVKFVSKYVARESLRRIRPFVDDHIGLAAFLMLGAG